jgi:hypothetical protein
VLLDGKTAIDVEAIRTVSPGCPFTLLIGNHPIIYRGSLESRFVVALPLSPYKMFLYTERGGATRREWLV